MAEQPSSVHYYGPLYKAQNRISGGIEKELRRRYASILEEPVPSSLVELMNQLEWHEGDGY